MKLTLLLPALVGLLSVVLPRTAPLQTSEGAAAGRLTRLQDQGVSGSVMKRPVPFALWLDHEGDDASLTRGKVYAMVPDERSQFVAVELPHEP